MTTDLAGGEGTTSGTGIWSGPYLSMTLANLSIVALVAFGTMALVAALSSIADFLPHKWEYIDSVQMKSVNHVFPKKSYNP